jgi:hypothetical protein
MLTRRRGEDEPASTMPAVLAGGRDLPQVVEGADREDHGGETTPSGSVEPVEDGLEGPSARPRHAGQQPASMAMPPEGGRGPLVDPPLVGGPRPPMRIASRRHTAG